MKSIITWAFSAILNPVPILDLSSIPAKPRGKLRLSPEQLLAIIHAHALAEWALGMTQRLKRLACLGVLAGDHRLIQTAAFC